MIDVNDSYNVAPKQRQLLSMMKDFHAFCAENRIRYSLIGGTLLGAVREKGFIPWDDDADILVDRENFTKLKAASGRFRGYTFCETLWVYRIAATKEYESRGITEDTPVLDICIADRMPRGKVKKAFKLLCLKTLQGMLKTKTNSSKQFSIGYKAALFITRCMGKLLPTSLKQRMYDRVSVWGNKDTGSPMMISNDLFKNLGYEYVPGFMDGYGSAAFEDAQFTIIKEWDNYLTIQYGDYMTPVREEH